MGKQAECFPAEGAVCIGRESNQTMSHSLRQKSGHLLLWPPAFSPCLVGTFAPFSDDAFLRHADSTCESTSIGSAHPILLTRVIGFLMVTRHKCHPSQLRVFSSQAFVLLREVYCLFLLVWNEKGWWGWNSSRYPVSTWGLCMNWTSREKSWNV